MPTFFTSSRPLIFTFVLFGCVTDGIFHNLTKRQVSRCKERMFRCNNGECISQFNACDGNVDCSDRSDETQGVCSRLNIPCPPFSFRCAYGACVNKNSKCDGKEDCADGSDEALCSKGIKPPTACDGNRFECTSGECIDQFSVCDGVKNCADGSDETITQCVTLKCPSYSFQCAYGACIDMSKRCNKVKDCHDSSDEAEDLCKSKDPKPPPVPPTAVTQTDSNICMLPNKPEGGKFVVKSCRSVDVPHNPECRSAPTGPFTFIEFSCNANYIISGSSTAVCSTGQWRDFPVCQRLCKAVTSPSLIADCFYKNDAVPCNEPLYPGTLILADCKKSYTPVLESGSKEVKCMPNGELSEDIIRCIPECGLENPDAAVPLINDGVRAKFGEYPWHVGLYYKPNKEQICGGTLITPNVVLTAAHCVFDERNGRAQDAKLFLVAAGKYKRSLNPPEQYQQVLDVRDVVLKTRYLGSQTAYEQDIALLDVVGQFNLSNFVLPACLDDSLKVIPTGTNGTVVGWGGTGNQSSSEVLLMATLPVVEHTTCRKSLPENFGRFITADKFCAGYMQGTGVQKGDSGGGLTFKVNQKHFIYGVVSIKSREFITSYAVFTNVSVSVNWIFKTVVAFKPYHLS